MIVSKFRPRVIPMLYSFYLIVYLICISYLILLFPFYVLLFFFVCGLYMGFSFIIVIMGIICLFFILCLFLVIRIGIILSLTSLSLGLCVYFFLFMFVLGSMIISGILFIYYFYDDVCLSLALCDMDYPWLMIILFCLFWVMGV